MAQQLNDLIRKVSSQCDGIERVLGEIQEWRSAISRDINDELGSIRERLASIENDLRWIREQREHVDGRLETGDHTFKKLDEKINQVDRVARWCRDILQKKPEETSVKKKILWKLLDAAAPMFVGLVFWLFYHFLLVGPKIAQILKEVLGGSHP